MKYFILVLSLSVFSVQAYDDTYDCSPTRSANSEIAALKKRIRELEAVVAKLQSAPAALQKYVVCSGDFFTLGKLSAKGNSETEAKANLSALCQDKFNPRSFGWMHCKTGYFNGNPENDVSCEQVEE